MYADIVGEIGSFRCLWNLLYGAYVFVMVIKDMNGVFFVCLQGWTLILCCIQRMRKKKQAPLL